MAHDRWVTFPTRHEIAAGSQGGTAPSAEAVLRRVGMLATWAWSLVGHVVSLSSSLVRSPSHFTSTCGPIHPYPDLRTGSVALRSRSPAIAQRSRPVQIRS